MSGRTDVPDAAPELAVSVVIPTSKAVANASGEWVGLLADDDMWGRYHLEEALAALHDHTDAVAFFGVGVIVNDDSREVRHAYSMLPHAALPRCANVRQPRSVP
jgi:hypothetical protein